MLVSLLQHMTLLAPGPLARAAAWLAPGAEERWLLGQPLRVRRSFAGEVLGDDDPTAREIWMLRQPDPVRESYVREVLEPASSGA